MPLGWTRALSLELGLQLELDLGLESELGLELGLELRVVVWSSKLRFDLKV